MSKGLIFDIKRYAINDGPGIRLTIFFKGCYLNCQWCHNPESISSEKEKMYSKQKCIGAQSCVEICPNKALVLTPDGIKTDTRKCNVCGLCADVCPTKAIEISGECMDYNTLLQTIESEALFFDQSGGGVTFSGGEPLMHSTILLKLLTECGQRHIHRVVDTCLFASDEIIESVAKETDLFLVDLKHMDDHKHKLYTGVSNIKILENLRLLCKLKANFKIRIPLIEGVNANQENIENTARFLSTLNWKTKEVDLLPYHDIGKNKHTKLGSEYMAYGMSEPNKETVNNCIQIFAKYGLQASIGG